MEARVVLPVCCWLDRRNGVLWKDGDFADQTQGANNVIIVSRKQ